MRMLCSATMPPGAGAPLIENESQRWIANDICARPSFPGASLYRAGTSGRAPSSGIGRITAISTQPLPEYDEIVAPSGAFGALAHATARTSRTSFMDRLRYREPTSVVSIVQHPDVASGFRRGEIEIAGLDVVARRGARSRAQARIVQVQHGAGRSQWL